MMWTNVYASVQKRLTKCLCMSLFNIVGTFDLSEG